MDACCEQKAEEIKTLRGEHRKVLVVVLVINAALFVVEAAAGLLANSTALLADSLDMLGDSLVYGFSLYVLWRSAAWKAKAAALKGAIMATFGAGVLIGAVYKTLTGVLPVAATMGIIGLVVLLGNGLNFSPNFFQKRNCDNDIQGGQNRKARGGVAHSHRGNLACGAGL